MAKRRGLQFDLIWCHINLGHSRANELLTTAQARIGQVIPGATLSVTRNVANTEALVKVTGTVLWVSGLPGVVRNAIIRTFTEADHHEAVMMIQTPEWMLPSEPV